MIVSISRKFLSLFVIGVMVFFPASNGWAAGTVDSTRTNQTNPLYSETKYMGTVTPTVTSTDLFIYPACPAAATYCADINGNFPVNSHNNASICGTIPTASCSCPDICSVTVVFSPPTSSTMPDGTVYYSSPGSSTQAACPPGYNAAAVFNPQPSFAYDASPAPVTNIASKADLILYEAAGYTCGGNGVSQMTTVPSPGGAGFCPGNFLNKADFGASAGEYATNISMFGTSFLVRVVNYTHHYDWEQCTVVGTCGSCHGPAHWDNYQAEYQMAQCTPPPGVYPTSGTAPASTLCSRTKSAWQTLVAPNR